MPSFKVRRLLRAMGGIDCPAVASVDDLYCRVTASAVGGLAIGTGDLVSKILAGSMTGSYPAVASAARVGSMDHTISGIEATGWSLFLTAGTDLADEIVLHGASPTGADTVAIEFLNTGSTDAASGTFTLYYLAAKV